jgi:hypothetical protein
MEMLGRAERLSRDLGLTDRAVFFNRGWVPYRQRAGYLLEADIGASCHLEHIETRFAFRTRLLDYIWAGLPMLVTEGDVLANLVERERLGFAVPAQDERATRDALSLLIGWVAGAEDYASRFEGVRQELTWRRAVEPLARFLQDPSRAADLPVADAATVDLVPTRLAELPQRALEIVKEGGLLLLAEEGLRYLRWLQRGR